MASGESKSTVDMLQTALRYATEGKVVFPLHGKIPLKKSRGIYDATAAAATIRKLWGEHPHANIGFPTGQINGIFVVDSDGPQGEATLADLVKKNGPLPLTYTVRTGRGYHYYFRQPPGVKVKSGACLLGPKLDVKGDGGYVVAPPSIHPETKRPYEVISDREPAVAPSWLIDLVRDEVRIKKPPDAERPATKILAGTRNDTLASLGGRIRRMGLSQTEIEAALLAMNEERCDPPLERAEVLRIAQSIAGYATAADAPPLTDAGNARRFAAQHGENLRYVADRKIFFEWDGRRWMVDDATGTPMTRAKITARSIVTEAGAESDDQRRRELLRWALYSESRARLDAIVALARDEHPIRVRNFHDVFDSDRMLLNVSNGTINLKTGKLQQHRREDYITKLAPVDYDPEATCPRFDQFLLEVMEGDPEMVDYLWRVLGYALTGDTRERVIFLLYGEGANGKTTLIERFANVLGDYAHSAPFKEFLHKLHDGASNEIAQLQGKRFVYSVEPTRGRSFDEAILKQLSGQDKVRARRLYAESTEWRPELKLFLAANHKPQIRETSDAIWDRVRLIPFLARFEGARMDRELAQKLDAELPGILAGAVRGSLDWQRRGLCPPEKVEIATVGYRMEMNDVGNFVQERCVVGEMELTGNLHRAYQNWAIAEGIRFPLKIKSFSQELERLGHHRKKVGGLRYHQGLVLAVTHEEDRAGE